MTDGPRVLIVINAVSYAPMCLCKRATCLLCIEVLTCVQPGTEIWLRPHSTYYLSAVAGHDMPNRRPFGAVLTFIVLFLLSLLLRPLSYPPLVFVPRTGFLL